MALAEVCGMEGSAWLSQSLRSPCYRSTYQLPSGAEKQNVKASFQASCSLLGPRSCEWVHCRCCSAGALDSVQCYRQDCQIKLIIKMIMAVNREAGGTLMEADYSLAQWAGTLPPVLHAVRSSSSTADLHAGNLELKQKLCKEGCIASG
jgi:hypothetical protein